MCLADSDFLTLKELADGTEIHPGQVLQMMDEIPPVRPPMIVYPVSITMYIVTPSCDNEGNFMICSAFSHDVIADKEVQLHNILL